MLTLVPAYGRDYNSQDEVKEAFNDGVDFIIQDISSKYDGKPANKPDLVEYSNHDKVKIRYKDKTLATIINL